MRLVICSHLCTSQGVNDLRLAWVCNLQSKQRSAPTTVTATAPQMLEQLQEASQEQPSGILQEICMGEVLDGHVVA